MVSSTLLAKPLVIGIDRRESLYYGKYQYRARLKLAGLNRTHQTATMLDVLQRLKRHATAKELALIDLDCLERFIDWRNKHATSINKSDKKALIRVESITAGVFSNDLQLLQTLESIAGKDAVDYTEIDTSIPTGVRYFINEPKHNYRVYLKSKRVEDKFIAELVRFIGRYKDTDTVIVPSKALDKWLKRDVNHWYRNYCSSNYYIEYNDESTHSLLGLMFGDMIKRRFKLEKRPD
jgi:hypothetical protein